MLFVERNNTQPLCLKEKLLKQKKKISSHSFELRKKVNTISQIYVHWEASFYYIYAKTWAKSHLRHFKTRSIIKCKRCLQRITEDQVLAYCEEEFKIKNFKLHVSQFYFAIIHAFNLPCLYLFRIMWPKSHWTVIVKRITHYPLSPRNKQKKGRCLLVLPGFFGTICFQTFCNIVKCAYFCTGAFSFLKGTERSRKETKGAPTAQVTMEANLQTDLRNSGTSPWLSWERLCEGCARRTGGGC